MRTAAIGYVVALATFVAADMAWLGVMARKFYRPILGDISLPDVNYVPAIVFYLVYPIGLLVFAVYPALKTGSMPSAIACGALFGFFTYATYDLTNQATLRNWTTTLTMVDMAWGTALGAITSAVSFLAAHQLSGPA